MPYANKEKEKQRQYNRLPIVSCPCCGKNHELTHNRMSKACVDCYPKYRQLYNLIANAKFRSNKHKKPFDLDMNWILSFPEYCSRTGIQFTYQDNGSNYKDRIVSCPSIDKIDPKGGYTKDNCQLVCWWYNVSKQTFTDQEVLLLCQKVVDVYEKSNVLNVDH